MKTKMFETATNSYRQVKLVGEGGSSRVYEVTDEGGKSYAIKCLKPETKTTKGRKRFANEIRFCSTCVHKNIVQVLDYGVTGEANPCPFCVMQLYPSTLRSMMKSKISPDKVLPYFSQILDGVEAAHLHRVWHRDLKPENVLYEPGLDLLVVSDFGIAHVSEEYLQTHVETSGGDRLANFQYAAPEQRIPGQAIDRRADIYSLGVMLNEMFTGQILQGTGYRKIGDVVSEYSYLDDIVDKMVQQSPANRPNSIDEVKQELIGRKNEFISRQRISQLSNTVVSVSEIDDPLVSDPIRIIGVDYSNGALILNLNRLVSQEWEKAYRGMGSFSYSGLVHPSMFRFYGNVARANIDSYHAQDAVNRFKEYLETTNREYKTEKEIELRQTAEAERKRIEREIKQEEERQKLLKSIRL